MVEDATVVVVELQVDRVSVVYALHEGAIKLFLELVQLVEEQEDVVFRLEICAVHEVAFPLLRLDDASGFQFRNTRKDGVAREVEHVAELVYRGNPVALLQSARRDAFLYVFDYQFVLRIVMLHFLFLICGCKITKKLRIKKEERRIICAKRLYVV